VSIKNSWSFKGHDVHFVEKTTNNKNPAVLLIHGFGASTKHWRHNIPAISKSYDVHAIDLLGFGKSAKPRGLNYGGNLWKDQIIAYVNERIKKPTVFVGNSLGGYAAIAAGSSLGENAAGVVLLNAAGKFSEEKKSSLSLFSKSLQFFGGRLLKDPLVQRFIFEYLRRPSTIRKTLNQVYLDKTNVDDELIDSIRSPSLDDGAFQVFRSVFEPEGSPGKPLDELFSELKAPLLLLWGDKDPWMNTPSKRSVFNKYTPSETTEFVLNAGHCPHDEIPEQVNEALIKWLNSINKVEN